MQQLATILRYRSFIGKHLEVALEPIIQAANSRSETSSFQWQRFKGWLHTTKR